MSADLFVALVDSVEVDQDQLGGELEDKGVKVTALVAQLGTAVQPLEQRRSELVVGGRRPRGEGGRGNR